MVFWRKKKLWHLSSPRDVPFHWANVPLAETLLVTTRAASARILCVAALSLAKQLFNHYWHLLQAFFLEIESFALHHNLQVALLALTFKCSTICKTFPLIISPTSIHRPRYIQLWGAGIMCLADISICTIRTSVTDIKPGLTLLRLTCPICR